MSETHIEIGDIHWLMDILQNIDVGLVVLDRDYNIHVWNGFMESHSAKTSGYLGDIWGVISGI